jgi:hypothetical protein
MNDTMKRRGPGRPPSKPPAPSLDKKGVVNLPKDPNNRLEFVYSDPSIFKSLFVYFKNIKAREIHLRCSPSGLTFFARDHSKTSRIFATIPGEQVNWYYCENTFWLGINRDNIEKIFSSIDKTFFKIVLIQSHDDPNSLVIIFKDSEIEKECNYKIVLSSYSEDDDLYDAENVLKNDEFLIEFTLTAKQFKKTINDASNYSETITFEKISDNPLQLTYAKSNITYNEVYRASDKIALKSNVEINSTFRATIKLNNIKSLASSMVTDEIRILCRSDEDILFRSVIDTKSLIVNTLTKLI